MLLFSWTTIILIVTITHLSEALAEGKCEGKLHSLILLKN